MSRIEPAVDQAREYRSSNSRRSIRSRRVVVVVTVEGVVEEWKRGEEAWRLTAMQELGPHRIGGFTAAAICLISAILIHIRENEFMRDWFFVSDHYVIRGQRAWTLTIP